MIVSAVLVDAKESTISGRFLWVMKKDVAL